MGSRLPLDLWCFHPVRFCVPSRDGELVRELRSIPDVVRVDLLEDRTVLTVRFLASGASARLAEETALRVWRSYAWHDGRGDLYLAHRFGRRRIA